MRLVVGLAALLLSASVARAEDSKAPEPKPEPARSKVPLRVVRMLPESHQALLYDRDRGTHVLADVGGTVDGYTVDGIEDDEVTLSAGGKEFVLAAPDQSWRRRRAVAEADAERAARPARSSSAATPVDPYGPTTAPADPYGSDPTPADPYRDGEVRSAEAPAPIVAGEGGVRTASAAGASAAAPTAPSTSPNATRSANPPSWMTDEDAPVVGPAAPAPSTPAPSLPTSKAPTSSASIPSSMSPPTPPTPPTPSISTAPEIAPIEAKAKGAKATAKAKGAKSASAADPGAAFADAMTAHAGTTSAPTALPSSAPTTAAEPAAPHAATATAAAPAAGPSGTASLQTMLARRDVDAALADFGKLTTAVQGSFTPAGAKLDAVAEGSLFARAGLRTGDVITAVDGKPVRSIDDAADLYARAGTTRAMTIELTRAGQPMRLRVTIQ